MYRPLLVTQAFADALDNGTGVRSSSPHWSQRNCCKVRGQDRERSEAIKRNMVALVERAL
jgi:hypothetical protein